MFIGPMNFVSYENHIPFDDHNSVEAPLASRIGPARRKSTHKRKKLQANWKFFEFVYSLIGSLALVDRLPYLL
jgi:hypothetical protein